MRFHHVVDFVHFYHMFPDGEWYWPTFNVADIAICVGIGLFLVLGVFTRQLDTAPAKAAGDDVPAADQAEESSPGQQ